MEFIFTSLFIRRQLLSNVFVVNPSDVERNGPVEVTLSRELFAKEMQIVSCNIRKYDKYDRCGCSQPSRTLKKRAKNINKDPIKMRFLPSANEVLEGYVFTRVCHSVHRGVVSQYTFQVSSPTPRRMLRGLAGGVLQAHTQGKLRGLAGGSPGPHPGGRLRGLAGGLQAHMWGGGVCVYPSLY